MAKRRAFWSTIISFGMLLGIVAIYLSRPVTFLIWFLALTIISSVLAKKNNSVLSGVIAGVFLWLTAFLTFQAALAKIRWEIQYPYLIKFDKFLIGLVLIAFLGIPLSWISGCLSIKNKSLIWLVPVSGTIILLCYFGMSRFTLN